MDIKHRKKSTFATFQPPQPNNKIVCLEHLAFFTTVNMKI